MVVGVGAGCMWPAVVIELLLSVVQELVRIVQHIITQSSLQFGACLRKMSASRIMLEPGEGIVLSRAARQQDKFPGPSTKTRQQR